MSHSISQQFPCVALHESVTMALIKLYIWIYVIWPLYESKLLISKQPVDQWLYKSFSKGLGNEDKVPCPRALLPLPADSNRPGTSLLRVCGLIHWATTAYLCRPECLRSIESHPSRPGPRCRSLFSLWLRELVLRKGDFRLAPLVQVVHLESKHVAGIGQPCCVCWLWQKIHFVVCFHIKKTNK